MNIHLAGIESTLSWSSIEEYDNFLITYAFYCKTKNPIVLQNQIDKTFKLFPNKRILLDSGAFSRALGIVDFTLQDYVNFLHRYGKMFFRYITLDIAVRGEITEEKILHSITETKYNLEVLEKEGLNPLPVYQRSWNKFNVLEEYLEKYDYICIAGLTYGIHENADEFKIYLDKIFNLNEKYKRKLHGLGLTTDIYLKQYPFYSVDSTSWLQGTKSATIYENIMDKYKPVGVDNKAFPSYFLPPRLYDGFQNVKTNYINRLNYNISFYREYQRILQELWRVRGIDWDKGIVK